jgi:hypothetical protein
MKASCPFSEALLILRSKISLGTSSSLNLSIKAARAVFDSGFGPPFFTLHHSIELQSISRNRNKTTYFFITLKARNAVAIIIRIGSNPDDHKPQKMF